MAWLCSQAVVLPIRPMFEQAILSPPVSTVGVLGRITSWAQRQVGFAQQTGKDRGNRKRTQSGMAGCKTDVDIDTGITAAR